MQPWLKLTRVPLLAPCILLPVMLAPLLTGPARAAGLHPVADIAARVAGFSGQAGQVDPRLIVPACPQLQLAMAGAQVVRVGCADPAWTVFVPLAAPAAAAPTAPARPLYRRGDAVVVAAGGPGFQVTLDAQADRDADADRLWVKTASGRRLLARIDDDGQLSLAGRR
jgi:flagella basal body P-ring formation protein FlgA